MSMLCVVLQLVTTKQSEASAPEPGYLAAALMTCVIVLTCPGFMAQAGARSFLETWSST